MPDEETVRVKINIEGHPPSSYLDVLLGIEPFILITLPREALPNDMIFDIAVGGGIKPSPDELATAFEGLAETLRHEDRVVKDKREHGQK